MLKVVRRYWFVLILPGLWLLAALLTSGGAGIPGIPTATLSTTNALAADAHTTGAGLVRSGRKDGQDCTETQPKPSFGGTVAVSNKEVVCGSLTSFGSHVTIEGQVRGDLVAFGGDVSLAGEVDGNVIVYGGNVTVQSQAIITGDFHSCGGQKFQQAGAQLHGTGYGCTTSIGQLLASDVGTSFRFWSLVTWLALGLLLTTFLPEHVTLVRTTVVSKLRRSLVIGLLSVLLAPAIIAISIALIISIPLAIIVTVGLLAAWALGTVSISLLIGDSLMRTIAPHQHARPMQVVVGMTVLVLAGSLPYIGWLFILGAGLIGLGAVFLSRFGTRLYSQPKQPITL
jgi:hypothetical protein